MDFTTKNKGTLLKAMLLSPKKEKKRAEEWLFLCFLKRKKIR
jgi:hypothetical protein